MRVIDRRSSVIGRVGKVFRPPSSVLRLTAPFLLAVAAVAVVACSGRVGGAEAPTPGATFSASHPRLFVTAERIAEIRRAIREPGSHHAEAFEAMRARVDQADWRVYDQPGDGNWNYARSYLAREAALMFLITEHPRYSQIAFEALRAVHEDPDPDGRLPESSYGLARAMVGLAFGIAYDWAHHGLTEAQRTYLLQKIQVALDAWPAYRHGNLETEHHGSNWVAVTRGGELVMMLAARQEEERRDRFAYLKQVLRKHMETAYGPSGWSQEGFGYTSYAGQFLLPAALALRSIGDPALEEQLARIDFDRLLLAAGSFTPEQYHLMSGVDGGFSYDRQGWASLVLGEVPAERAAEYRFFYDRFAGRLNSAPVAKKYDPDRAGTTWALLYYPEHVPPRDPDGSVSRSLFDRDKGVYLFRNRWENQDDLLISFMGDYHHHGNAWDVQEAFQLGLIGFGTPFIGGPGKDAAGKKGTSVGFSSLLVDGAAFPRNGRTGAPVYASSDPSGGGYVIVDGGEKYAGLGLEEAKRHLLVRFTEGGGAVLATLDRLRSDEPHEYTWQLNPGGPRDDHRVRVTTGSESFRPTFTIFGEPHSYLKGWVLHPANAKISADGPLRVIARGADEEILVAMIAGRGDPPPGNVLGFGLESQLQVGGRVISYHSGADRILVIGGEVPAP